MKKLMPSPFIGGRISPQRHNKVLEHCAKTGKEQAELFREALATYLKFPKETSNLQIDERLTRIEEELINLMIALGEFAT
jgi:hypothetical protein